MIGAILTCMGILLLIDTEVFILSSRCIRRIMLLGMMYGPRLHLQSFFYGYSGASLGYQIGAIVGCLPQQ